MPTELLLTEKQVRMALSNLRASGVTWMHPMDFLRLTTKDDATIEYIASKAETLATYNGWALMGSLDLPPFLDIDLDSDAFGRVKAHEGRHRAASVLAAGGDLMAVALIASEHGRVIEVPASEFPRTFVSQFRPTVKVKRKGVHPVRQALEVE